MIMEKTYLQEGLTKSVRKSKSILQSCRPIEYRYVSCRLNNCCKTLMRPAAADLHPVHDRNRIFKFADDTYLIVPGSNTDTCQEEIQHLQTWANANNLQENCAVARKPRDAAAVLFSLKFADDIHYKFTVTVNKMMMKFKSSQASKARLQRFIHTGAKQFNAKWRFKVIQSHVFWSQWKGDKALSNTV